MQQTRSTLPGLLLALVAVSAWGLSYIATEWLYTQGLGPFAVLTIRTFLAYAVLLILSHKQFLADELIDEAKFALLGVACIPFYHGLENLALQETNAGTVATIMASAPLFTAFVVIALHHSFRLHWMTKLGIVTVATGMCLIWFDNHVIQQLPEAGFYLALGAALAWACYSALLKSVHKYGAVFMARKTFGWGLIAVMPFYLMEDAAPVEALTDPVSTALLVFLAYCFAYVGYTLLSEGDLSKLNYNMFIYFGVNCVFLLFAYLLIYIFEKAFGFISTVTLVELSDVNNPILRQLSEECPGTFQHSLQISNLAAEAANKIGAKAQLVRTGALYHDIGKLKNPAFFTENQSGFNPHTPLSFEQSAQIVISHVNDGLKMADKLRLPQAIKDFISTHHGHGKAKFFYNSFCNKYPDQPVDESKFTYPGPNPFTKETGILMMADAVEAASRSLKEYTNESISQLVNRIIDSQVADGLLRDTPLSFRDVETIKATFIEKLKTIYHTRISYPELNKTEKSGEKETTIKMTENGTSTDSSKGESNREEK